MRDMAGKIAELKFEAPLARFEEEDTASLKNMNLLTGAKEHTLSFRLFPRTWFKIDLIIMSVMNFY